MDSLKIQDAFDPYYAGRERPAASKDGKPSGETDRPRKPSPRRLPAEAVPSAGTDNSTEH